MGKFFRIVGRLVGALVLLFIGPACVLLLGELDLDTHWRSANRDSANIAAPARARPEALVQVWGARAFNWRGAFGLHTWIALKPAGAADYEVHQVIGWYARQGGSSIVSTKGRPDRRWYGAKPELLAELRGPSAAKAAHKVREAIANYPAARTYVIWPGPNSNSFVAHIARQVPELKLDLPPHALGKDYLVAEHTIQQSGLTSAWIAPTPSNTGYQVSIRGLLGLTFAMEEGVEANVLGLSFGIDPNDAALKLPGIGRLSLRPADWF